MRPDELSATSFSAYPPQGNQFALHNLMLLRQLPLAFAILMLREIFEYDWRFPAERKTLESQFAWLQSLAPEGRTDILRGFAQLSLLPGGVSPDWSDDPKRATETMTAHLWATGQIDTFRTVASAYDSAWRKAIPETGPSVPRLCIVVLGAGLESGGFSTFQKLRPHGVFFSQVDPANGMQVVFETLSARASGQPHPYGHWYIDGGKPEAWDNARFTRISWDELQPLRGAILQRMQQISSRPASGPELLRTLLAKTTPRDVDVTPSQDELLDRFKISVLTEGSGTQIFSTVFAQWSAREILRRAQPSTLLVRFAPRQRQLPMGELLAGLNNDNALDPRGSLIDADMGAFYTWVNQQRLAGAGQAIFIAWCQHSHEAVAIGPGFPRAAISAAPVTMKQILAI